MLKFGKFNLTGNDSRVVYPPNGWLLSGKVRDNLAIPEDLDPVAVIAIGYPGNPDYLPEDLKKA